MINIEDYYEKGYIITKLPESYVPRFWYEIYSTDWVEDMDSVYKQKPSWYSKIKKKSNKENSENKNILERKYGSEILNFVPESYLNLAKDLIQENIFDTLRYFKNQSEVKYLHLWNGAEDIPWHTDTIDSSDTLIFVYLTEEPSWKEEWGGSLSLRKELFGRELYEAKILPKNGTMIIVNNTNPLIKHKVEKLKNLSVNRYTFSLCYEWK